MLSFDRPVSAVFVMFDTRSGRLKICVMRVFPLGGTSSTETAKPTFKIVLMVNYVSNVKITYFSLQFHFGSNLFNVIMIS